MRRASVGAGDDLDDGEAEAGSVACPCRIAAAERLEGVRDEVRRETGALILHMKLDPPVHAPAFQEDRSAAVA
jgi:hypothetical protein